MATTWLAVWKVAFSSASSPRLGNALPSGKRESYSSGHKSWWSKTNLEPSRQRSHRAMGQKMSGGLHACRTRTSRGGEHGRPAMSGEKGIRVFNDKPIALPPGA